MPSYIVTLKDEATDEQVQKLKDEVKSQGGEIKHEYSLIKAFSVSYPEGTVQALGSHELVKEVEQDQEVRTQ
ncbi:protease propeptide/inhibitor [Canariomyces notabilis]|jgi:hypothetical protein|uniref:Protease propeptide/inhibitor n=1 Tax=Canariomyces notabilis TaxID=2074819 RepID=A0AAN6TCZ0_9PEZI|nr:protease propeptide/inhibitor [Canariomyces arenarius]